MGDTKEFLEYLTRPEVWKDVMPVGDIIPKQKHKKMDNNILEYREGTRMEGSTLPPFIRGSEFPQPWDLEKRPPLVEGLFRAKDNVLLGAPPKMGKSWFFATLGLCLAKGNHFLGLETKKSKVLLIDLELHRDDCLDRLWSCAGSQGLEKVPDDLWVWCLREFEYDLDLLITEMDERIEMMGGVDVIILDPIYMLGHQDFDENNASSVKHFLKAIAQLKMKNNSALLLSHHFSKGNKGRENHSDRISGSGAFQRWPDSLITLTPHPHPGCANLEVTGRSMPKVPGRVVNMTPPGIKMTDLSVEF